MSKLSKAQYKRHHEAIALLQKDILNADEREFVIENWQESANHVNSAAGAFFTPLALAWDFEIEVGEGRILDLCAGIGALAYTLQTRAVWGRKRREIVCVEINEDYAAVGRKLVPEATWIVADVFDLPDLGAFNWVVANPPFGRLKGVRAPRYKGSEFDLGVVDVAASLAPFGTFILPQGSLPFRYSGEPQYREQACAKFEAFNKQISIEFSLGCIDCSFTADQWRGASPKVEIVTADFLEAAERRAPKLVADANPEASRSDGQPDFFGVAA